jgi:peptidoglycan/LPS O-acetylase OafA/YrhL
MGRIPELDALRGIATLAVLLFHWRFHYDVIKPTVDLFFVLSGYFITTILLGSAGHQHPLRTFYLRRSLRIFPIYYLAFAVFLLLRLFEPHKHRLDGLPYFLTYTQFIQGYWGGACPPFSPAFGHTWTLAIEEQFYLFWPLIVLTVGRRGLLALAPALLVIPSALRTGGLEPFLLLTRCDGLLLGALLAAVIIDREWLERQRPRFVRAFGLVGLAALPTLFLPVAGTTWARVASATWLARLNLLYACGVGLIVLHVGHPVLKPLRARWLQGVGRMSYGLYLYHPPVFLVVAVIAYKLNVHRPVTVDIVKLAITFGVAWLSWHYIEQPIIRLKGRFHYKRSKDADEPAPELAPPRVDPAHPAYAGPVSVPQPSEPRIEVRTI